MAERANRRSPRLTNNVYISRQYETAGNLNARIALHERFSINPYSWMCWVFDHLELRPRSNVLEVGCGTGLLWTENAERLALVPDCRLCLSDLSTGMMHRSRVALSRVGISAFFTVAHVEFLPFPDASFDIAIANHMLYHVPERKRALAELRRVLRTGGCQYASTNGAIHMLEISDLLQSVTGQRHLSPTAPSARDGQPTFDLDHGAIDLGDFFPEVELRRYEDGLAVTDATALLGYIESMHVPEMQESPHAWEQLRRLIDVEMECNGGIFRIQKESGLFLARG